MPNSTCQTCGHDFHWKWEDAFNKFGFDDGDGQVMTETVADILRDAGYEVQTSVWGLHNTVIEAIEKDGNALIPATAVVGYDDPHAYLPPDIVALLDLKCPDYGEVVA